ncbi:MAG: pilus assembly protein TadE [Acidobacteria bacterium]|nr:MAG: pilus assembly protein TadE [Acidobacteriota bacterium]
MSNISKHQLSLTGKTNSRRFAGRSHRQRGSAMLELAVAVPLLALVLAGVMEFGRVFYTAAEVSNAARAGVQYAAINTANASNFDGMQQAATNDAANVPAMTATASQFCECPDGTSTSCSTGSCSLKRTYVKVVTSAQFRTMGTYPGIPNPISVSSQATLRVQ